MSETTMYRLGKGDRARAQAEADAAILQDAGYYAVAESGTLWVLDGQVSICRDILDRCRTPSPSRKKQT